jgi:glycosyltransferase involved in cell wall biosynthesis
MGFKNLPSFEKIRNINIHRVKCIRVSKNVCTYPEMILYLILALPVVLKLCNKNKYHINNAHFIFPDGVLAFIVKALKRVPYILTAHGSDVPRYNPDRFRLLHKFLLPLWKKVTSNSEKIVFPSKNLESIAKNINPELKTIIIPNAIKLDKYSADIIKKKQILIVTRMFERKGVQYFLAALKDFRHDYEVNIVGDGPYLAALKNIAKKNNLRINFLGYVDNSSDKLKRLYEESDIFVFTSESENFPVVLLEAMLAGTAIITANDNGCSEVVGEAAVLVNSRNSNDIRGALIKLMNDQELKKDLQSAARKRVEKFFNWERIAKQYFELYKNYSIKPDQNFLLKLLLILAFSNDVLPYL